MMSKTNAVTSKITLTEKEKELFALLMSVAHEGFVKVPVLRVAGGWVRDKLLGRLSDDIDIAIDTLTGKQFTDVLKDYLLKKKGITQKVAIIKSNPEQSKHLETATVNLLGKRTSSVHLITRFFLFVCLFVCLLLGIGIDFVNLRSETYSEGSRIPTMVIFPPI